jgi:hypothetical protein
MASSTFDSSSLYIVPSGIKAGTIFPIKPLGTANLDFARNSNATRVNSAGLIEKVRTNLILQSQTFQTTWGPIRASVSTDTTTAPDGTTTADTLFDSVDANIHYIRQNFSALTGPATISVFAKANQLSQIQLVAAGGTTPMGRGFNLSTGTTFAESVGGVVSNDLGQSITAVGNGWYRCTMSWTSTGQNDFWLLTSVGGAATFTGTGTNGVFIWGAQLETGDIATDYIPTTTAAVSVGITADIPRLDYTGGGCPSLLLEPQRTNLALRSEQFDNAYWEKLNSTVTANAAVSPDGYTNADKLIDDSTNAIHRIRRSFTILSNTTYIFSVFLKKAELDYAIVSSGGNALTGSGGSGADKIASINLNNGNIVTNNYNINVVEFGNGWYRVSISLTTDSDGGTLSPYILTSEDGITGTYVGSGKGIYLYGAQLEIGAYATSYIPTLGSSVTRLADAASKTGISSLIGQSQGTLYAEVDLSNFELGNRIIGISDESSNNRVVILLDIVSSTPRISAFAVVAGSATALISSGTITQGVFKIAVGYANDNFALYINGTQIGEDLDCAMPACSAVYLGSREDNVSTFVFNNRIRAAAIYTTRLTNAELASLTSL